MRALRSKDFPQDRQTKLQNTLPPPPSSPYHPHASPRFITVQETPHCSRLWLTQLVFSLSFSHHLIPKFIQFLSQFWIWTSLQSTLVDSVSFLTQSFSPFFLTFFHLFTFSLFCHFWTLLQLTLVDSVSFLTQFFTSLDPQVHSVPLSVQEPLQSARLSQFFHSVFDIT